MKWIFVFDHYHYARWGTCLDISCNFIRGNFSFQKSYRRFLKVALDPGSLTKQRKNQRDEWRNTLNCNYISDMDRWETSSPEIERIIENFESVILT